MEKEKIIELFLNSLRSGENGELYILTTEEKFAVAAKGTIEKTQLASMTEAAFRILKDNKIAFGYTGQLEEREIKDLIASMREILPYQKEKPTFTFPEPADIKEIRGIVDHDFEEIDAKTLSELAVKMEKSAREFDRRITTTRDAKISAKKEEVTIVNSMGVNYTTMKTLFENEIIVVAEEGVERGDSWDFSWAHKLEGLKEIGINAAERAVRNLKAKIPHTGLYPVIIENKSASMLLSTLFYGFVFENIFKRKSPLIGKLNENIFSEKITMANDGSSPFSPEALPFDGEGVATGKKIIVEDGALKDFIYDIEFANREGKNPSGSVVRSNIKNPPSVGEMGFYISPCAKLEEVISSIKRGLFITDLMGLHTVDPVTWQFSLGAKGFLIENGKISTPLHQFTISGDFLTLFQKGTPLNDLIFIGGSGSPSIFFEEINIAGE